MTLILAPLKDFGAYTYHEFTKHQISALQTGNYCRPYPTAVWISGDNEHFLYAFLFLPVEAFFLPNSNSSSWQ